jgi:mRNA-decapping enzyme subunit 2
MQYKADILARFLINLPQEEYESGYRIFYHLEQAYWFSLDQHWCADQMSFEEFVVSLLDVPKDAVHKEYLDYLHNYKYKIPVCGVICLCIFQQEQHILLVQDAQHQKWGIPKGKQNKGESNVECARRELEEETGLKLSEQDLIPLGPMHTRLFYCHLPSLVNPPLKPQHPHEIVQAKWIPLDSLAHYKTTHMLRTLLRFVNIKDLLFAAARDQR